MSAGAALRYHGDLDPVGVGIAGAVIERLAATPWRLSMSEYENALARVPEVRWHGQPISRTPWDPALEQRMSETRMSETGRAVYEEHVVDGLLEDMEAEAARNRF